MRSSGRGFCHNAAVLLVRSLLRSIFKKIPGGAFGRNVVTLAGSVATGQALTLAASPLLTRLYSVTDFGLLQAYLSALLFLLVASAGRYELAIVLPEKDQDAADLTVLCIGLTAAVSISLTFLIWLSNGLPWIGDNYSGLRPYLWFMPITLFGAGSYTILAQWSLRQKNYAQVGRSKIFQSACMVTTQLTFGWLGGGFPALTFGDALGRVAGISSFVRSARVYHGGLFIRVTWLGIRRVAHRYRRFPQISVFSALINSAGFSLPPLLIAAWYSPQVLGWYAMADRVMTVPTTLVGSAISQVYTVDAARLAANEPKALRVLFFQIVRRLAWLGIIPFSAVLIFGPALFTWVFGPAWEEAGYYARWLAIMQYVGFIVWPVMPTLIVLERQAWQLAWDIARLTMTLGAISLASVFHWPAREAVAAYCIAMMIGYIAHAAFSLLAICFAQKVLTPEHKPSVSGKSL